MIFRVFYKNVLLHELDKKRILKTFKEGKFSRKYLVGEMGLHSYKVYFVGFLSKIYRGENLEEGGGFDISILGKKYYLEINKIEDNLEENNWYIFYCKGKLNVEGISLNEINVEEYKKIDREKARSIILEGL